VNFEKFKGCQTLISQKSNQSLILNPQSLRFKGSKIKKHGYLIIDQQNEKYTSTRFAEKAFQNANNLRISIRLRKNFPVRVSNALNSPNQVASFLFNYELLSFPSAAFSSFNYELL